MAEQEPSSAVREYLSAAGKRRAAARRRLAHLCEQCGRRFEGLINARFCSSRCRVRAFRARRRGDAPEADDDLPELIRRLDATSKAIARGRIFPDSTDAIREGREERDDAIWPDR